MGIIRNGNNVAGILRRGRNVAGIQRNGELLFERQLRNEIVTPPPPPGTPPIATPMQVPTYSGEHIRFFTARRYPGGSMSILRGRAVHLPVRTYYYEIESRIGGSTANWNRISHGTLSHAQVATITQSYSENSSGVPFREFRFSLFDFIDHRIMLDRSPPIRTSTVVPNASSGGITEFSYANRGSTGQPRIWLTAIFNGFYTYRIEDANGETLAHGTAHSIFDVRAEAETFYVLTVRSSSLGTTVSDSGLGTSWLVTNVSSNIDRFRVITSSLGFNAIRMDTDGNQDYFFTFYRRFYDDDVEVSTDRAPGGDLDNPPVYSATRGIYSGKISDERVRRGDGNCGFTDGASLLNNRRWYAAVLWANNNGVAGDYLANTGWYRGVV